MKYFTIKELTKTNTGLENTPSPLEEQNLHFLVDYLLDPIRELWGRSIIVSSGFRSEKVNKAVGGSSESSHLRGLAADIQTEGLDELFKLIIDSKLQFDQLIMEFGWIHISIKKIGNRNQILQAYKEKGKIKYKSISI